MTPLTNDQPVRQVVCIYGDGSRDVLEVGTPEKCEKFLRQYKECHKQERARGLFRPIGVEGFCVLFDPVCREPGESPVAYTVKISEMNQ